MEREVPTWVIEGSVFRDNDVDLADAVWRTGGCVVAWRDEWSTGQAVPGPDGLRLLELNPFSGADLYACDRDSIVSSLHQALLHL